MISSKGIVGVIIWILVGDLEKGLKSHDEDKLDINGAIRGEILNYIKTGIISTTTTSQTNNSQDKISLKLTIIGHDDLIRSIKRQVRAAPTSEIINESFKKGIPLSQIGVKKKLRTHRNSLNIIAQKLTKIEEENVREGSIAVTNYPDSVRTSYINLIWSNFIYETPAPIFEEFLPGLFSQIRSLFGVDAGFYKKAFINLTGQLTQDGGASGALFFLTENERFFIKSCSVEDRDHLLSKANDYCEHLKLEKNSLIAKIYGCYSLEMYSLKFSFFVMANIIPKGLQEKYDVKGSWIDRETTAPRTGKLVTCKHCLEQFIYTKNMSNFYRRNLSVSSKNALRITTDSLSGIRNAERNTCSRGLKGIHEPLQTMKDLDLKYKIKIDHDEAIGLFRQIEADAQFLCETMGVMDYSLLIGVKKTDISTGFTDSKRSFWDKFSLEREGSLLDRNADEINLATPFQAFEANVIEANHLYYFGIIDFLQPYNFDKKVEHMIKTVILRKDSDGISCIKGDLYKRRFISHIADLLDVNDEVEARI